MLKKKLLTVLVAFLPSYSYSESITPYYGYTPNAASGGLNWSMGSVFPSPPGLSVNGVIYNYTIQKNTEDSVTVNIQNENAQAPGQYIFRETDEWKPGSLGGTEINKVIGLPNIPRELWGDGSIDVQGPGSVTDPKVVYTYRVDPCYDPQFDPNCPGYKVEVPDIPQVDPDSLYDAVANGDADQSQWDPNNELYEDEEKLSDEEKAKQEEEEKKDSKERLEKALAAADTSALFAQSFAMQNMLDSMQSANLNSYYAATIPGGKYQDTVSLVDSKLPESRRGLRNGLAQQLLHQQMVEMQYNK